MAYLGTRVEFWYRAHGDPWDEFINSAHDVSEELDSLTVIISGNRVEVWRGPYFGKKRCVLQGTKGHSKNVPARKIADGLARQFGFA